MLRISVIVLAACLGGCQPQATGEAVATPASSTEATLPVAVPESYNWSFLTHGGSGDLWFGDGQWSEGQTLLWMSCLPGSGEVSLTSEAAEGAAAIQLEAGRQSGAFAPADGTGPVDGYLVARAAANHPVMAAFRSGGVLTSTTEAGSRRMAASGEGVAAIASFFTYCG